MYEHGGYEQSFVQDVTLEGAAWTACFQFQVLIPKHFQTTEFHVLQNLALLIHFEEAFPFRMGEETFRFVINHFHLCN